MEMRMISYLASDRVSHLQGMVTTSAFFYPLVLLSKYSSGRYMVFVDLEQEEEGAES